ncbi:MAG: hypothetical protein ACHBN1_28710 [Heteroscytonema crispum UTEX LB 1556]
MKDEGNIWRVLIHLLCVFPAERIGQRCNRRRPPPTATDLGTGSVGDEGAN